MSYFTCILAVGLLTGLCAVASGAVLPLEQPGMSVRVQAGQYRALGRTVKVPADVILKVDPPDRVTVRDEEILLTDEKPATYHKGTVLRKTLGPVDTFTRLPKILDPASVRIHSAPDGGTVYDEGTDYFLDHDWGGLSRTEGGRIPQGAKVYADYDVFRQRIDVVQVTRTGLVLLKKGRSAAVCPEVPAPYPGCIPIANIYVPYRTAAVTGPLIYPMPSRDITWKSLVSVSGREDLRRTLGLLRAGKPVTVVCWGDSVTCGGSASSKEKTYVELFRSRLKAAYPAADITLINAGIGGSNTDTRRDGFEQEVLAHNPDLITVEFVNDVPMTPEHIADNYAEFMAHARARNPAVEFIIITPHFVMPEWMGNFDKSVPAMRAAAKEHGAALADAANIWEHLREVGIPYETLEANGINHPNDLGHEFFAETLMRLLSPNED